MRPRLFHLRRADQFRVKVFLIIAFPFRVIWISLSTDFCVPLDRHVRGGCEIMRLFFCGSEEHPVVSCNGLEVLLRNPFISLSWVFPFHPPPHLSINLVVYRITGFFATPLLL